MWSTSFDSAILTDPTASTLVMGPASSSEYGKIRMVGDMGGGGKLWWFTAHSENIYLVSDFENLLVHGF